MISRCSIKWNSSIHSFNRGDHLDLNGRHSAMRKSGLIAIEIKNTVQKSLPFDCAQAAADSENNV